MESSKSIFVDFNNADKEGRVRLNTKGTFRDIELNNLILKNGEKIFLTDNEISTEGILVFSKEENIWVAEIKWEDLK